MQRTKRYQRFLERNRFYQLDSGMVNILYYLFWKKRLHRNQPCLGLQKWLIMSRTENQLFDKMWALIGAGHNDPHIIPI